MSIIRLVQKLYRIGLFSPLGIYRLTCAIRIEGINLMTLLRLAAQINPKKSAISDETGRLTYMEFYQQSRRLSLILSAENFIDYRQRGKLAIICHNHSSLLLALFAGSRLGAKVYLLSAEIGREQLQTLIEKHSFDALVYDDELWSRLEGSFLKNTKTLSISQLNQKLLSPTPLPSQKLPRSYGSRLVVLTGGTSGLPKLAARKPSLFQFLPPVFALLLEVELERFQTVFIASPLGHGFGIASSLISIVLGAEQHLQRSFEAKKLAKYIEQNRIEVVTLVPLMLQRLLEQAPQQLYPLQRLITGGAPLSPALAAKCIETLGPKLFNLYGTSEAGFCIMASPQDLLKYPKGLGRAIMGVRLKIIDEEKKELKRGEIGQIYIRSSWTISGKKLVPTGDLAYMNQDGYIFLCGRTDDMIVSGGDKCLSYRTRILATATPCLGRCGGYWCRRC